MSTQNAKLQPNKPTILARHPAQAANNDFIYMTLPLLAMALYLYGLRPLALCFVAVITANLCDRFVAVMRRLPYDKTENSSIAWAMIATLLMPARIPYYTVIVTVIVIVVLGKAVYGGWGAYPFTPAALGVAFATINSATEMTQYTEPFAPLPLFGLEGISVQSSATHTLAVGGLPNISLFNLLLGNYAGGMGTTASVVVVACAAYLWMRKRITLAAPLGFLGVCVCVAYFFPRLGGIGLAWPWQFMRYRLLIVVYEVLSGAILYASVFLLSDETTLPRRQDARLLYGMVAGGITMAMRYYGSFEMAACFAILWANVLSGSLDRWMSALAQRGMARRTVVQPAGGAPGEETRSFARRGSTPSVAKRPMAEKANKSQKKEAEKEEKTGKLQMPLKPQQTQRLATSETPDAQSDTTHKREKGGKP